MDEILASIRRIIADDQDRAPPIAAGLRAQPAPPFEDEDDRDEDEPRPPAPILEAGLPVLSGEAGIPTPARDDPSEDDTSNPAHRPAPFGEGPAVVAPQVEAQVIAAFGRLAEAVKPPPAPTLEDHVTGMLRPMLKAWLDENLPALAERMVRAEIERIARGR